MRTLLLVATAFLAACAADPLDLPGANNPPGATPPASPPGSQPLCSTLDHDACV
jgi:hypothetical protein